MFAANLLNKLVGLSMLQAQGDLDWASQFWAFIFYGLLALGIFLPRGRMAVAALVLVLLLSISAIVEAGVILAQTPVWPMGGAG